MFTQMMVDIHANVSTNQLEDYLQYVKQKKKRSKTWRQGRPWNQARSDMKEEWGMACEGSELSVCVCVWCVCVKCVCAWVSIKSGVFTHPCPGWSSKLYQTRIFIGYTVFTAMPGLPPRLGSVRLP